MELNPCPFCGGSASVQTMDDGLDVPQDDPNFGGSFIECDKCGCCTKVYFDRKENMAPSWNQRAE